MSLFYCSWRNVYDNKRDTLALLYRKSSIKPPGGLFILNILEAGLIWERAYYLDVAQIETACFDAKVQ